MPSGAAGVGSKSSLKGRHEDQCALGEPNDDGPTGLCAPTGIAIPIAPLQTWTSGHLPHDLTGQLVLAQSHEGR